jgi:hypothetical protein
MLGRDGVLGARGRAILIDTPTATPISDRGIAARKLVTGLTTGRSRLANSPCAVRRPSNAYNVPPLTPEAAASSRAVTPGRSRTTASTASRLASLGARARAGLALERARPPVFAAERPNILRKLDAKTRSEAAAIAYYSGLLEHAERLGARTPDEGG